MQYFIEKLDRRHTGYDQWQYRLRIQNQYNVARTHHKNFHTLRAWMIEQYGLSSERDLYELIALSCKGSILFDPPWCWHVDRDYPNNMYIYVKNDAVLSNIQLKWH